MVNEDDFRREEKRRRGEEEKRRGGEERRRRGDEETRRGGDGGSAPGLPFCKPTEKCAPEESTTEESELESARKKARA